MNDYVRTVDEELAWTIKQRDDAHRDLKTMRSCLETTEDVKNEMRRDLARERNMVRYLEQRVTDVEKVAEELVSALYAAQTLVDAKPTIAAALAHAEAVLHPDRGEDISDAERQAQRMDAMDRESRAADEARIRAEGR